MYVCVCVKKIVNRTLLRALLEIEQKAVPKIPAYGGS